MDNLPATLTQFFTFIGTPVFAAWVVSEGLEHLKVFQRLTSQGKMFAVLGTSIVLGLVSFGLVHWVPQQVVESLQPIYAIIIGSVGAFLSSQWYHNKTHSSAPDAGG